MGQILDGEYTLGQMTLINVFSAVVTASSDKSYLKLNTFTVKYYVFW